MDHKLHFYLFFAFLAFWSFSIYYSLLGLFTFWFVGELRDLYGLSPVAVIGGSFLPGLTGHNISEAAAAGCAVLTGDHLLFTPFLFDAYVVPNILLLDAVIFG